jgi:hypothetical protein
MFVNSALAFASAELITAALHEAGHGLAAQALGFSPHIYAFYENNPTGDARQTLTILAAGPMTSLVLGALFWGWYLSLKPRYSYARLLFLWLALIGVMKFVNYLIVTPWLTAGDTAHVADVLQWPTSARYGLMAVGVALLVILARPAATAMLALAPRGVALDSPQARRRCIMGLFYLPLVAGVARTALAGIGSRPSMSLMDCSEHSTLDYALTDIGGSSDHWSRVIAEICAARRFAGIAVCQPARLMGPTQISLCS